MVINPCIADKSGATRVEIYLDLSGSFSHSGWMDNITFDTKAFRNALGSYGTGVAIVTACDLNGTKIGMTINSFASVSLNPPLILWSVQNDSPSSQGFRDADHFAVTILSVEQQSIASKFARTSDDKFTDTPFTLNDEGVPLLEGGLAQFECRTYARYPGGDHEILVGEVLRFRTAGGTALGFLAGRFMPLGDIG
jgi:flavin reductase (DIM6/NTAB) family NADH-FMN oxidoreductase RutF